MAKSLFYTLCIPFIDIYITDSEIVNHLGLRKNEMTVYSQLLENQQKILYQFAKSTKDIKAYYGGMSYNTCVEIAKKHGNTKAVFIGPFSRDCTAQKVFADAISGKIEGLEIVPEFIESGSGVCFVIPNGKNRAMVTKANPDQQITRTMVDTFISRIRQSKKDQVNALYIAGYTVETSPETLLYLIEKKKEAEYNCLSILNLADPGVIDRSYDLISLFIEESDWIIGNKEEYIQLFAKTHNRKPESCEELYEYMETKNKSAIITAGSEAVVAIYKKHGKQQRTTIKPKQIEVKNTTGAGDVFAANFFAYLLENQEEVSNALEIAIENTNEYLQKLLRRNTTKSTNG